MLLWYIFFAITIVCCFNGNNGKIPISMGISLSTLVLVNLIQLMVDFRMTDLNEFIKDLFIFSIPLWFSKPKHILSGWDCGVLLGGLGLFVWDVIYHYYYFFKDVSIPFHEDGYTTGMCLIIIIISCLLGRSKREHIGDSRVFGISPDRGNYVEILFTGSTMLDDHIIQKKTEKRKEIERVKE
jgi:hypothetical protein